MAVFSGVEYEKEESGPRISGRIVTVAVFEYDDPSDTRYSKLSSLMYKRSKVYINDPASVIDTLP